MFRWTRELLFLEADVLYSILLSMCLTELTGTYVDTEGTTEVIDHMVPAVPMAVLGLLVLRNL